MYTFELEYANAIRYTQIWFGLRCMFPTWSDWDIKYTAQGLLKQRAKKLAGLLAILGTVMALTRLRKDPDACKSHLRNYVRSALLSGVNILQLAEKKL